MHLRLTLLYAFLRRPSAERHGFTLVELAIVPVIIGLVIGGVLVGTDMIASATLRAQITQIDKFNSAVHAFQLKYDALPGDLDNSVATKFGFVARGSVPGQGDGNGVIEGSATNLAQGYQQNGETLQFWVDLTVGNVAAPINVNMIEGSFTAFSTGPANTRPTITAASASGFCPPAKLKGNFVYVYSTRGINYYGIAPVTATGGANGGMNALTAGVTVQQAYQIDSKIDDGFPATGSVSATWDSGDGTALGLPAENSPTPPVNAQSSNSPSSCYNNTTAAGAYSLSQNNGSGLNCALSFKFR